MLSCSLVLISTSLVLPLDIVTDQSEVIRKDMQYFLVPIRFQTVTSNVVPQLIITCNFYF